MNYSPHDVAVAAQTSFGEARGQPWSGQVGVVCVGLTRARLAAVYMAHYKMPSHPLFGDGTLARAFQVEGQFDCWSVGDPNLAIILKADPDQVVFRMCAAAAGWAMSDRSTDPTQGATHYYNPKIVRIAPTWAAGRTPCVSLGDHVFFNDVCDQTGAEIRLKPQNQGT